MKTFFGSGYFQWVGRIRENKNILFLTLLFLQFLFARMFWGFMLPDNTVYLLPYPGIVSAKSGSLKIKHLLCVFKKKENLEKRNNLEENANL